MEQINHQNRLAEFLIQKSALQRELENRKRLESGIRRSDDSPIIPRSRPVIEAELRTINDEINDIENALSGKANAVSTKGNLKEAVQKWAESSGFVLGKSVASSKISKFVRDNKGEIPKLTDGAVRSTLSRLGYSEEKKKPET